MLSILNRATKQLFRSATKTSVAGFSPQNRRHHCIRLVDLRCIHRASLSSSSPMDGIARFALSPTTSLVIQRGDITKWSIDGFSDAIVNPTNERMLGGGGADGGYRLPVGHVVYTVGPIFNKDSYPEANLRNAYRNSLIVAKENNIKYIAFPAISCGVYGYPFDEAATVAISTIKEFANDIEEVHFVHFLEDVYYVWLNKANELTNA